jgi:hypothetical protein
LRVEQTSPTLGLPYTQPPTSQFIVVYARRLAVDGDTVEERLRSAVCK